MQQPIPPLRERIRRLVATPSISSTNPDFDQGNMAVVEQLAEWLEALGARVQVQPVPGEAGKANLIASIGAGSGGLVLSGHTDTVPYDEGRWRHDPFGCQEADGRLYGLGTADMKSFLALAVEIMARHRASRLAHPLTLLATANEESDMSGARALAEAGRPLGRFAVIGEPTSLRPVRMHKGILMEGIRVIGRSGHSSNPALGVSALEAMHRVMGELLAWRTELQERYREPLFQVPVPTLNLGHIHGGDSPNRICPSCELHMDLRTLPGMDPLELRHIMHQRLGRCLEGTGAAVDFTPLFAGIPSLETPADSALVRAAEELTGEPAGAVAFGTEGPYLQALGMETVVLGPGSIDQAHQPDEYLPLDSINPTLDILDALVVRFCGEGGGARE